MTGRTAVSWSTFPRSLVSLNINETFVKNKNFFVVKTLSTGMKYSQKSKSPMAT